jgi:hypothetical protein
VTRSCEAVRGPLWRGRLVLAVNAKIIRHLVFSRFKKEDIAITVDAIQGHSFAQLCSTALVTQCYIRTCLHSWPFTKNN